MENSDRTSVRAQAVPFGICLTETIRFVEENEFEIVVKESATGRGEFYETPGNKSVR